MTFRDANTAQLYLFGLLLAVLVLLADYMSGPRIEFPILYLIPIAFIAWYVGARQALILAVAMPLIRFYFRVMLWDAPGGRILEAGMNGLIRMAVFALFAILIARVAEQQRALQREIKILQGFLPICSYCKSIRTDQGRWDSLESYISEHSEARFTHSICPRCEKEHYGELLNNKPERH